MERWVQWQNWTNVVLGFWLLISPVVLGTIANGAPDWNAWVLGVFIAVVALLGLAIPNSKVPESANIVVGAWLFFSPWVLGFADLVAAAWNARIVGLLVAVFAAWALSEAQRASSSGTGQRVR